ncbi:hypothetical protein EBESD8_13890 [Rhodococcus aetherivorans]|nr:hypothetical protein EBESD8_13890 [Rhodococcus aetherivorans]
MIRCRAPARTQQAKTAYTGSAGGEVPAAGRRVGVAAGRARRGKRR